MKVEIEAANFELGASIKKLIKEKVNNIEKFAKEIFGKNYWNGFLGKGKPRAQAFFEIKKLKGPYFYVECQMELPGKLIRATAKKEDLEIAINSVKEKLERLIKKYKKKPLAKYERGARRMKRKLKISTLAKKKEPKRVLEEGS